MNDFNDALDQADHLATLVKELRARVQELERENAALRAAPPPPKVTDAMIEAAARAWVKRRGDVKWEDIEDKGEWLEHAACAVEAALGRAASSGEAPNSPGES